MLKTDSMEFVAVLSLIITVLLVYGIYQLINRKPSYVGEKNIDLEEERKRDEDNLKRLQTIILLMGVVLVTAIGIGISSYVLNHKKQSEEKRDVVVEKDKEEYKFEYSLSHEMIKQVNSRYGGQNFLISPYSMTIALEMLRDGSSGDTRAEIDELLNHKEMIERTNIPGKIATANGLFVKEDYKQDVLDSYYKLIKDGYEGEILYDSFETPKVINDWITKNTNEMIKDPIKSIDKNFILGIFNALAIDVEWENKFQCESTTEETFRVGNADYKVEMMHQEYQENAKYFELDYSKGVILPYKTYDEKGNESEKGTTLEFVAVLPDLDLKDYLDYQIDFDYDEIDKKAKKVSSKTRLELSLPRFEYDFSFDEFAESLKSVGVESAFSDDADFSNISKTKDDIKVGSAVHETYIKLGETGTKAAAVTGFAMVGNAYMPDEYKTIEINFDKPFFYMIRDSKTKEVLFMGGVYKPNLWKGITCENE